MKSGSMGRWIAAGSCAAIVAALQWVGGPQQHIESQAVDAQAGTARATPRVRVPAQATTSTRPQPFAFDTATARAAVRDGEFRFALPDGSTQAVRIERQFTDSTGHWNIVGRAQTRVGPQAMVLTFGPDAVFGTVPMPDGHQLSIATQPGGKVTIARAGGLLPEGLNAATATNDVIVPPRKPQIAVTSRPTLTQQDVDAVMAPQASKPASQASAPIRATTAPVAAAAADTVQIDVLAYYSPDLVTLRGSASAAETEVAHLFAIANQSHIDSGTRVRLNIAKLALLDVSTTAWNSELLDQMQGNTVPGVDLEGMRDGWGADLVTLIRPYHDTDGSCGIAYLAGAGLYGTNTSAAWGYSVVNVAPCGPHVLAHELGHSMGSMHNREEATAFEGDLSHGAFMDSFGYRVPGVFATIMAYQQGEPWVGFFSNPASAQCQGHACGVTNYANNVRSLDAMAPAIAAFRGPMGTLSIADALVLEPTLQQGFVGVPIRLSASAPAGGITVDVTITGGNATPGTDYALVPGGNAVVFSEGMREAWFWMVIEADADVEADETVTLHIASTGAPIHDADATVTILNDDPRPRIGGRMVFDAGVPVPTTPIDIVLTGLNDDQGSAYFRLQPPDFAYSLPVRFGGPLTIDGMTTDDYVIRRRRFNEVIANAPFDLRAERGVVVSGRVRAAAGLSLPDSAIPLTITDGVVNHKVEHQVMVSPPDYAYRWRIPKRTDIFFETPALAPFVPYSVFLWGVDRDTTFDVTLSTLPTARLCCDVHWNMPAPTANTHGYLSAAVYLSAPAPAGGATFRYRIVDGSAKAGEDFLAESGTLVIPEGEKFGYLSTPDIQGDDVKENTEYFDLIVDQVTGAQMPIASVRFWIIENERRTGGAGQMEKAN